MERYRKGLAAKAFFLAFLNADIPRVAVENPVSSKIFDMPEHMLAERKRRGKLEGSWSMGVTGRDVFHWWMEDGVLPGQYTLDDIER